MAAWGGDTVQPWPGGELPQAEEELEQELVRCLLAETGGVPILNWTFGGDIEIIFGGAGELLGTGTEIFRDLVIGGNCLLGDLGELAGEEREEHLGRLRRPGLGMGAAPEQTPPPSSSSGSSIEPPLAELTPDMAETEIRCSSPGGFWIREFWIAA